MWNVNGKRLNDVAAAVAIGLLMAAGTAAQALENPVGASEGASVAYTECTAYKCSTTELTPEQVMQKVTPGQRSAILNKDCKSLRSEFGKYLEDYPFEFRDTAIISCIDDRATRLWITESNYRRFLANKDAVTTVAEYHEYLGSVGYTSKRLTTP